MRKIENFRDVEISLREIEEYLYQFKQAQVVFNKQRLSGVLPSKDPYDTVVRLELEKLYLDLDARLRAGGL